MNVSSEYLEGLGGYSVQTMSDFSGYSPSQPSQTFSVAPPCGGVSSFSLTPLSTVPDLLIDRHECDGWLVIS